MATASSIVILVAPDKSDLFNNRCSCSFLSVPIPGGISERQPLSICPLRFSTCLRVSWVIQVPGDDLHFFINLSKFSFIFATLGVLFIRCSPRSSSCLKTKPNSFANWFLETCLLSRVFSTRWHAWKRSSLISAWRKIDWYFCRFLQQSSMQISSMTFCRSGCRLSSLCFKLVNRSSTSLNAVDFVSLQSRIFPRSFRTM